MSSFYFVLLFFLFSFIFSQGTILINKLYLKSWIDACFIFPMSWGCGDYVDCLIYCGILIVYVFNLFKIKCLKRSILLNNNNLFEIKDCLGADSVVWIYIFKDLLAFELVYSLIFNILIFTSILHVNVFENKLPELLDK